MVLSLRVKRGRSIPWKGEFSTSSATDITGITGVCTSFNFRHSSIEMTTATSLPLREIVCGPVVTAS